MRVPLPVRRWGYRPVAYAVAALATMAIPTAAQALTTHASASSRPATGRVSPLYICPSRSICLFKGTGLTGTHMSWNTQANGGHWINLHNYSSVMPHRSAHNNSGSDVWLANVSTHNLYCLTPGFRGNFNSNAANSGWMWIRYGVNNCNNPPPIGPPGSASRLAGWPR